MYVSQSFHVVWFGSDVTSFPILHLSKRLNSILTNEQKSSRPFAYFGVATVSRRWSRRGQPTCSNLTRTPTSWGVCLQASKTFAQTPTHAHSAKGTTRDVFRHDSTLLGNMSDSCCQIYSFTINVPAVKKKKKTQLTDQDRRWRITAADTFDLARQHEGVISCKYCTVKPLRDGFMEAISFRKDTFTSVVFALSVD